MATNLSISGKLTVGGGVNLTSLTASRVLVTDGSKNIISSSITSTELGYLDGVTSAIQTQLNNKAASSHTHSAATTSTAGFMSTSDKTKLDGIASGANKYTLPTASSSTLGGVKTTSTVTSTSGLTACPIISGVPYYKDTNTTYSLSSFGITATAAELNKLDGCTATVTELNYVDGVTSNIQTQLNGKAASSHTHSGTQVTGLTASRALVSNSSGQVSVSAVTSTELSYLDGVTRNIQTQLNNKSGGVGTSTEDYTTPSTSYGLDSNNRSRGTTSIVGTPTSEVFNLEANSSITNNLAGYGYSHAEGWRTVAAAMYSHTEGYNTATIGAGCHGAHSEGYGCVAGSLQIPTNGAHAEGCYTQSNHVGTHAEGFDTIASQPYSHAEGYKTKANAQGSHAEGSNTTTTGIYSHAEGDSSQASGQASHAEGYQTTATGFISHAEGYQTTASGYFSHAEGQNTKASGQGSHAEGYNTKASGQDSHAEGESTEASGDYSHAEGSNTIASSDYQHVQGKYNVEDTAGTYAHIVGWGTSSSARKNIFTITTAGAGKFASSCTATSHPTSSSRRFKENIRDIDITTIDNLFKIEPKMFDLKEEYGGDKDQVGFIAEDIEPLFPSCVFKDDEGNVASIDYSKFIPYIIKLLQEWAPIIESVKNNETK